MKEFFTYEQQIDRLKEYGLIINDEQDTYAKLKDEGYYNIINGYSPLFKRDSRFIEGVSFDHIMSLYEFDKSLRKIVYNYTSLIETHIKALIAHEFSRIHGVDENAYLSIDNFSYSEKSAENIQRLIDGCKKTIEDARNRNSNKYREYIEHNYNVHGHVPLWVLIRAISFGTTSIFFMNMKSEEKEVIANNYNIRADKLGIMLEIVVSFRNIVAHGERTFCARLPRARLSTTLSIIKKLNIERKTNGENKYGRNDFLALLVCCKYLLSPLEFAGFIQELNVALEILEKAQTPQMYKRIKTHMGLRSNSWEMLPKLRIEE